MKEEVIKCYCGHTITCDCGPKQETLEEITKIICHTHKTPIEQANEIIELLQQQMYSEEEVDKMISDFKHDLIESTSNYVKQNCEGAIFGLSRLKNC